MRWRSHAGRPAAPGAARPHQWSRCLRGERHRLTARPQTPPLQRHPLRPAGTAVPTRSDAAAPSAAFWLGGTGENSDLKFIPIPTLPRGEGGRHGAQRTAVSPQPKLSRLVRLLPYGWALLPSQQDKRALFRARSAEPPSHHRRRRPGRGSAACRQQCRAAAVRGRRAAPPG